MKDLGFRPDDEQRSQKEWLIAQGERLGFKGKNSLTKLSLDAQNGLFGEVTEIWADQAQVKVRIQAALDRHHKAHADRGDLVSV